MLLDGDLEEPLLLVEARQGEERVVGLLVGRVLGAEVLVHPGRARRVGEEEEASSLVRAVGLGELVEEVAGLLGHSDTRATEFYLICLNIASKVAMDESRARVMEYLRDREV